MLDLRIAKPCDQTWTAMSGDETVRHCKACQKNVYNISEMTEAEVEELVQRTEGHFCARLYRRSDSRVMTKDCPRGVAKVQRRMALGVTSACAMMIYGCTLVRTPKSAHVPRPVMGSTISLPTVADPYANMAMGEISVEVPTAKMGKVVLSPKRGAEGAGP